MARAAAEQRLETLVRDHRFTIAVVFPLVGAVILVASAEAILPALIRFNPALLFVGVLVMRLPLIAGLLPVIDRRSAVLLLVVSLYAYGIEFVGTATGWPYGSFTYGVELGPMLHGVPLGLPLLFLPLVINAYLLTVIVLGVHAERQWRRLPIAIGVVLAIDFVLDPAAVALGFWTYAGGGGYYGVPASNFAGWLLSATIAVLVIDRAIPHDRLGTRLDQCEFLPDDLVSFILLWGAINAIYAQWLPVAIATLLGIGLFRSRRYILPPLTSVLGRRWRRVT